MSSQEPQQQFSVTPQSSETPLISSDQRQVNITQDDATGGESAAGDSDPKTGKRKFFGLLGKKKDEQGQKDMASSSTGNMSPPPTLGSSMRSPSPGKASDLKPHPQPIPISPNHRQTAFAAASPSRMRSSSPRLHSPADSEIFERSVQEPAQNLTLQGELSPAHIPSHVITEDHIPPALEASANAITSEELNPDEVEIVTSTSHLPAGSALEASASQADLTQLHSPMSPLHPVKSDESEHSMQHSGMIPHPEEDGYGSLDPTDVRRLSFISFADIVQSEHQQAPASALSEAGNRDSLHFTSLPSSLKQDRAASPLRSSRSGGVTTPPPGVNVTAANLEQSPGRTPGLASPLSSSSELQIQTMRQAVRKTASGDLSGGRSAGMSPVSDEHLSSAPRSRTNS